MGYKRKLRGDDARRAGRAKRQAPPGGGMLKKCEKPHPHDDCPAACVKFKGHLGKHVGYVMQGVKDNETGDVKVRGRVEVQWTDAEAAEWAAVKEGEVAAGAGATPVRSTDGRTWTEDKILPAEG